MVISPGSFSQAEGRRRVSESAGQPVRRGVFRIFSLWKNRSFRLRSREGLERGPEFWPGAGFRPTAGLPPGSVNFAPDFENSTVADKPAPGAPQLSRGRWGSVLFTA